MRLCFSGGNCRPLDHRLPTVYALTGWTVDRTGVPVPTGTVDPNASLALLPLDGRYVGESRGEMLFIPFGGL